MPRRGFVSRRSGGADPVHGDALVARMINGIMRKGKKTVAERIVYGSMEIIKEKAKEDPVAVLKKAVENTKPLLEVKSRRVGGATYQVPVEVRPERRLAPLPYKLVDRGHSRILPAYFAYPTQN